MQKKKTIGQRWKASRKAWLLHRSKDCSFLRSAATSIGVFLTLDDMMEEQLNNETKP